MEEKLNDIPVMYLVAEGGTAGARDAFKRLEGKLPSLRGRKFYGTFQPVTGEYRACVALEPGDEPDRMGLTRGVIPGGLYAREKMKDWMSRIDDIGRTFTALSERQRDRVDTTRPSVEFYRSQNDLILLLPIR